jgi:DNA invertase Pin-like site-specific DNA recombinase
LIKREILDELIGNYKKPEDLTPIGETGLLKKLTKALTERALEAELTQHLGYEKVDRLGRSLRDLITTLDDLRARAVKFHPLTEAIDTATPKGRAI